ncbi:four helix bundle protein [Hymenobacter saemangeumensis]|uniref:Four helix bundle protein n=1 Tax=Hymenobacter saemangeumensis TaxID=1084522 RepID=A0ABP8IN06_9BACT
MDNKSYTELLVWQHGRRLASSVYALTKVFPKEELFGLSSQMRRAAVSIPSNIAEGCGRQTPRDTINFLFIARGSLYELETQLYVALDQSYLTISDCDLLLKDLNTCKKLLQGFINHYKSLLPAKN